ncbi:MAG: glycosyltransferase [Candidatus Cloacimonadia bacterium]
MKKLKVLRIITRLNVGGPTIHTVLLTNYLNTDAFESHLLAGEIEANESDMSYFADRYNVKPIYLPKMRREIRLFDDFRALLRILKIIREIKPDIVHTHTAKAGMLGRSAAIIAKVPFIYHTFHGNVFKGYFSKSKTQLFISIERFLAKRTTKIIAISEQQKKELADFKIAPESKIEVIKLGFDFSSLTNAPTTFETPFRKEYNVPAVAKLIGIIGRLVPIKNHNLFLEIAENILKSHPDVYFAIIGDGELRADVEADIISKGLQDRIFITGFLQNLRVVYQALDLVLLTSNNEGTPVALIEAMVSKKIIMSTQVGGVEDFVQNRLNGFYFPAGKSEGFIKEITHWLSNPEDYSNIGEKAYDTVIGTFSSQRLVKDIESLYLKSIG